MSHVDLISIAARWLNGTRRCGVVLTERGLLEIPDAIGWGATCIVVECKVSRGDFLADLKKPHRHPQATALGRERWYLTPRELLDPDELPAGWGLLEWNGRTVRRVKQAQPFALDEAHLHAELRMVLSELRCYHAQGINYKTINGNDALPHLAALASPPAPERRQEPDWQPISTAPKDGSAVLLFPSRCWVDESDCGEVGYWSGDFNGGWVTEGPTADDWTGYTHWLHLSPPHSQVEPV